MADPFAVLNASPVSRKVTTATPEPEDEESLLSQLGSGAISGLSKVGNLLDLPGSMVRDVLGGENPFDQWLSPLSHGNNGTSLSGRDMLAQNAVTGLLFSPNEETGLSGWLSNPLEGVQDVLGFGAELATDPLALITGWAKGGTAATKAASATAKTTGAIADGVRMIDRAGDVVADPLRVAGGVVKAAEPTTLIGKAGKTISRGFELLDTVDPGQRLGKAARDSFDAGGAVKQAADAAAPVLSRVRDQVFDVTRSASARFAASRAGRAAGRASTTVSEHLSGLSDATRRQWNRQFDSRVRSTGSEYMQQGSRKHTAVERAIVREATQPVSAAYSALQDVTGWRPGMAEDTPEFAEFAKFSDDIVEAIESGTWDSLPEKLLGPAQQMKVALDSLQTMAHESGLQRADLSDLFADFFPHEMSPALQAWDSARSVRAAGSGATSGVGTYNKASQSSRGDLFRNAHGGRRTWNEATKDDDVFRALNEDIPDPEPEMLLDPETGEELGGSVIEPLTEAQKAEAQVAAGAEVLRSKYGDRIDPRMPDVQTVEGRDLVTLIDETGAELQVPVGELDNQWERVDNGFDLTTPEGRQQEFESPWQYSRTVKTEEGTQEIVGTVKLAEEDRFTALAKWMKPRQEPLAEAAGVFNVNPLISAQMRIARDANTIGALKSLPTILSGAARAGLIGENMTGPTLRSFLKERGDLFKNLDVDSMLQSAGVSGSLKMDPAFRDEIEAARSLLNAGNQIDDVLGKAFRGFTASFKSGVLVHPAFHIRNLYSGMVQLAVGDAVNYDSLATGWKAFWKRPAEEFLEMPQVKAWMDKFQMEHTAENATKAVHAMYATLQGHGQSLYRDPNLDTMDSLSAIMKGYQGIGEAFPGTGITGDNIKEVARGFGQQIKQAWQSGTLDPFDVAGVPHVIVGPKKRAAGIRRGDVRTDSTFKPVQVSDQIGKNVDNMPRFVGFVDGLMKGLPADEAFEKMTKLQLSYDPKSFGPIENRWMKKLFPFYSFMRQQSVYMANELMTNPTGRLGRLIRLSRTAQPSDVGYLPDYIGDSFTVPLGEKEDGTRNYVTGFGLMFEDPPKLLGDGLQDTMREILSRSNPILKGIAEFSTGRSTFQSGPLGGRDIVDMDPVLGRIFTNVGLQDARPNGQAAPAFGSRTLEFALSNSPVSRILSNVKTLTESSDRKNPLEKALNLATGIKVTSVSPQVRARGLRDLANAISKELGASAFTEFNVTDELLASAEGDPERYATLLAIKELKKIWDKRRRAEKKAQA